MQGNLYTRRVTPCSAMAELSSSGILRSLIKDSGTCAGNPGFREWKLKLREAINFHSSDFLSVLNGTERPTETATSMDAVAAWGKAKPVFSPFLCDYRACAADRPDTSREGGQQHGERGGGLESTQRAFRRAHSGSSACVSSRPLQPQTQRWPGPHRFFHQGLGPAVTPQGAGGGGFGRRLPRHHALWSDRGP